MERPRVSYFVTAYMDGVTNGCQFDGTLAVFGEIHGEGSSSPLTISPATFQHLDRCIIQTRPLVCTIVLLEQMHMQ